MTASLEPPPPTSSKSAWRSWAKRVRASLPDVSEAVCARLEVFLVARAPRQVLAYQAFGSEINLGPLIARHPNTVWLTTRVQAAGQLSVHAFSSATVRNPWGILEPPADAPQVAATDVDMALVPGVLFDTHGGRLGYGKGFYDRLLPHLRDGVPIIGITRDALIVTALPLEPTDIAMTHLASESGVHEIQRGRLAP